MEQRDVWYEADTGTHQGLVVSEVTGDNIAVTYDKKHARLVAAAPELLDALEVMQALVSTHYSTLSKYGTAAQEAGRQAREAIAKAGGA